MNRSSRDWCCIFFRGFDAPEFRASSFDYVSVLRCFDIIGKDKKKKGMWQITDKKLRLSVIIYGNVWMFGK